MLCLIPKKFEDKKKKKDLKLINYLYMFLETHFTYFPSLYKNLIILKYINY